MTLQDLIQLLQDQPEDQKQKKVLVEDLDDWRDLTVFFSETLDAFVFEGIRAGINDNNDEYPERNP
jgi:hypothetical protein